MAAYRHSEDTQAPALRQLFDLTGQVAIITGGSRGLGLQIAEALGEFGAKTVLIARKEAELSEAVSHLTSIGMTADAFPADLAQLETITGLVQAVVERHGPIDILVNNAGATWGAPAEAYPLEAWAKVINVNLTGLFVLTQEVASACFLARRRGRILNISSTEGLQGHHPRMLGTVAYNASKGAVINMTRALAAEWGPKGITVNALAPGYFRSKMTAATLDKFEQHLVDQTPLGKLGSNHDLKGAALLLASDAGGHITGQVLVIDGGASII